MMILFKYTLGSLRQRWIGTSMTAFSFTLVTAILITLLSMVKGIEKTLMPEGSEDRFLAISNTSNSENQSRMDDADPTTIASMPEIKYDGKGVPEMSIETVASAKLSSLEGDMLPQVVRGVDLARARAVHDRIRIVAGRFFRPNSLDELIIGKGVRHLLKADVGSKLRFRQRQWTVVGVFDDANSPAESEIWMSRENMIIHFKKDFASSVWGRVKDRTRTKYFVEGLNKDSRVQVFAYTESDYFKQGASIARIYKVLGWVVAGFLSIGAIFSGMNTMYANLGNRIKEFATMRAIGFKKAVIFRAALFEGLLIAIFGGLCASLLSVFIDGLPLTVNMAGIGKVVYEINATPGVRLNGFLFSVFLGLASGWLPARNSIRINIVEGLKT